MKERGITTITRGLIAAGAIATYGYLAQQDMSARIPSRGAPLTARLDYADRQLGAAMADLNGEQLRLDLFDYRLSLGQQDPSSALEHVERAYAAVGDDNVVATDLSIAQDIFSYDMNPQPAPVYMTSSINYPTHPWDSERTWLSIARQDIVAERLVHRKGGS